MIDEKIFEHAVTLTAAFVANGDFRCGGSTRENSTGALQVGDMLTTMYAVVQSARQSIEASP